jgi:predicted transcriptional regulator of viral defense system
VTPAERVQTDTGYMRVSTPEATAFDLVRFAAASGGLGNVASVLTELAERLDTDALRDLAAARPTHEVQRLGYLFDAIGRPRLADPLARGLAGRRVRAVLLAPRLPATGERPSSPWKVLANTDLGLDV